MANEDEGTEDAEAPESDESPGPPEFFASEPNPTVLVALIALTGIALAYELYQAIQGQAVETARAFVSVLILLYALLSLFPDSEFSDETIRKGLAVAAVAVAVASVLGRI